MGVERYGDCMPQRAAAAQPAIFTGAFQPSRAVRARARGTQLTLPTMIRNLLLAGAASLALVSSANADKVGQQLPPVILEGLSQTKAESFDEFTGQLVLIEFFAYW